MTRSNSFLEVNKAIERVKKAQEDLCVAVERAFPVGTEVRWIGGRVGKVLRHESGRIWVREKSYGNGWIEPTDLIIAKARKVKP